MRSAIAGMVFLIGQASPPAAAEDFGYGKAEYLASCAVCHGEGGRGDGPFARELVVPPADLTMLAASNAGRFPYWRVFAVIDGRYEVPGHGTREMPIWGREFLSGDIDTYGPKGGEVVTEERIHALSGYIESLQQ